MNATSLHIGINAQDYRDTMQAVAEAYLLRHQAEHLDEGQLFERACNYLVNANEVPVFMAQRLVYLAMSKISPPRIKVIVGMDWATGPDQTVLIDTRDGIHRLVPRRVLPQRFLAHTVAQ
jgi:hypothetical protein